MDRELRRVKQILSSSKYSELSAAEYGRLLYLQNSDKYMNLCISHGFFPSDEECEDLCSTLLRETFKSIGRCIYKNIEVEIGTYIAIDSRKTLFRIVYARRPKKQ